MAERQMVTVFTQEIKDLITEAWESEREDWGDDIVDHHLERLNTIPLGTEIIWREESDVEEMEADGPMLVQLSLGYYGWPNTYTVRYV